MNDPQWERGRPLSEDDRCRGGPFKGGMSVVVGLAAEASGMLNSAARLQRSRPERGDSSLRGCGSSPSGSDSSLRGDDFKAMRR